MKRLLASLAIVAACGAGVVSVDAVSVAASPCKDSNGAAAGGHVYWPYSRRLTCDMRRPQQLNLTQTPSKKACNKAGGTGWTSGSRICWGVDY